MIRTTTKRYLVCHFNDAARGRAECARIDIEEPVNKIGAFVQQDHDGPFRIDIVEPVDDRIEWPSEARVTNNGERTHPIIETRTTGTLRVRSLWLDGSYQWSIEEDGTKDQCLVARKKTGRALEE